jgi:hypothetical protein
MLYTHLNPPERKAISKTYRVEKPYAALTRKEKDHWEGLVLLVWDALVYIEPARDGG